MRCRAISTCLILAFLAACGPVGATSSLPTALSTLVAVSLTPMALVTETATRSPTIEKISPTPEFTPSPEVTFTLEPTITATLPPLPTSSVLPTLKVTSIPQPVDGSAVIQIYGPGPLSKLVSPVQFFGYAVPGYGSIGRASLYGEDGRELDSELLQLNTAYRWAYFYWTLPFKIQGAGELGRLSMSTQDNYGRINAVYSIHLILLPEGFSIVNPPGDFKERCFVEQPAPGFRITGGTLEVAGEMRPFSSIPLVVELIDRAGNVLAAQPVTIAPASDDSYVPFQISLQYAISSGKWALLTVHQLDDRIPGMMYLYSQEVFLNP